MKTKGFATFLVILGMFAFTQSVWARQMSYYKIKLHVKGVGIRQGRSFDNSKTGVYRLYSCVNDGSKTSQPRTLKQDFYIKLQGKHTQCDAYIVLRNGSHLCNVVIQNYGTPSNKVVFSQNRSNKCTLTNDGGAFQSTHRGAGVHYGRYTITYTP